jgi:tetratricopeptide (TPR) repeat protein
MTPQGKDTETISFPDELTQRKEFYRTALAFFHLMIEKTPHNPPAWGHIGLLLYELGRYDESIRYFTMITDHDPENSVAWDARGFIHLQRGDFPTAAACFEEVIRISPKRLDVVSDLTLCRYHEGKLDEAKTLMTKRIGKKMGTKEHFLYAKIALREKKDPSSHFQNAIDSYEAPDGPVREGVYATANAMRAIAYFERRDEKKGEDALCEAGERASNTDPDRMILSAVDLRYKIRREFITELKQLLIENKR